jgi:spermidine synthase
MSKPRGNLGLLSIVALAGAGTMVVELAAVRVLAPWFGSSVAVWTNVIGVVLLALALGYLLGSRLAARSDPGRLLGWSLVVAALAVAWLPVLANPVAGVFLPEGVTLDRAASLLVWGSLASAFVLFAPAALALGCVGPLAVECVQQRSGGHAGTAGGAVLFASTMGSLVGTFGTTHYLVPVVGISLCFQLAGAGLALLGLVTLAMNRARLLSGGAATLAVIAALLAPGYRPPGLAQGSTLLAAEQSPYQTLRIVQSGEENQLMRQLQVNEGFDSFQSVWQPETGLLPPGYYYNYFALPPWWSGAQESWRCLVLGLGAGTSWRVLEGTLPEGVELDAHGVELDPQVVALARRWMELPDNRPGRKAWSGWDARAALSAMDGEFDQIVLDTYANQMEIPAHLCSLEFFEEVEAQLVPGGWLCINIGGFDTTDPVVRAVAGTAAAAFGREVLIARVPFSRNCVAFLRRDAEVPRPLQPGWAIVQEESTRAAGLARLLVPLELPGAVEVLGPEYEAPLTDDRNGVEILQRESIRLAASRLEQYAARP